MEDLYEEWKTLGWQKPEGLETEKHETHSEEWVKARQRGLGGSDWTHILEAEYGCQRNLFYSKSGTVPDYESQGAHFLARGRREEPVARAIYCENTKRRVDEALPTFTRQIVAENGKNLPCRINVDGVVYLPGTFGEVEDKSFRGDSGISRNEGLRKGPGILEIKNVGQRSFEKYRREGLPAGYIAQPQYAAGILGFSWVSYAIRNSDAKETDEEVNKFFWFDADFDSKLFNSLINHGTRFWTRFLEMGEAPPRKESSSCNRCDYRRRCRGLSKSGVDWGSF